MEVLVTSNLLLLPVSKGGRHNPVTSGYRGKANFLGKDNQLLITREAILELPGMAKAYPGDKFQARLRLVSSEETLRLLKKADKIVLKEGNREIGNGVIVKNGVYSKNNGNGIPAWKAEMQKHPRVLEDAKLKIRALNHPLRQKMLSLINKNGNRMNVTDIHVRLRIEQSVASQHLAILRNQGLVETERVGKTIWYSVNDAAIERLVKACNEVKSSDVSGFKLQSASS